MSANVQKLNDVIEHYKRHINRSTEANDNEKIMKCITKLSRLPITVQNLQKTGIGRVVNSLRKYDGNLGESAKALVIQWKNVVKIEESENFYQRDDISDEEHQDVSPTNDNEEFQVNQNITSSVASTSYYNNNNNDNGNEPESNEENIDDLNDHESSRHRHHDKSKNKKSKRDKDSSKNRKESNSTSTDDQGEGHVAKKIKKEHKYENSKTKKEHEKCEITTKSHRENDNKSDENVRKEKKSSHSDKKKDKHRSAHKTDPKSSHKDKHHESKSSHKDKDKSDSKKKSKDKIKEESKPSTSTTCGISSSNKTFEEALLGIVETGKKKQVKSKCRDKSSSSERESSPIPESMGLAPLNLDPEELITNYKPLPQIGIKKKKLVEDVDPLAKIMTTKNLRTKVFSGNKTTFYTDVPSLVDCCIQTIKENLDALEFTGGVPFIILEPILKYATPDQLYTLEHYNDYLIEDTGELWKFHCNKEFRSKIPEKNESWRQFYIRCLEERETKLAKLRQNINANQAASTPVRKTQLAYVDTAVKPPRSVARKQAKLHMAVDTKQNILNKSMLGENSTSQALSANNRSSVMATSAPVALTSAHSVSSSSATMKKKKAPLMQKALQLIKSTRRR